MAITLPGMNTTEINHFGFECSNSPAEVAFRNQVESYNCDFPIRGMLVGADFGVGKLPERAAERLWELGITTLIGNTFANSFQEAAEKVGILCALVDEDTLDKMIRLHQKRRMHYFHAKLAPEGSNLMDDFHIVLTSVVNGRISEHSWSHCINITFHNPRRFQLGMLKILGHNLYENWGYLDYRVQASLDTTLVPYEARRQAS